MVSGGIRDASAELRDRMAAHFKPCRLAMVGKKA
jgi:hypothetical protein